MSQLNLNKNQECDSYVYKRNTKFFFNFKPLGSKKKFQKTILLILLTISVILILIFPKKEVENKIIHHDTGEIDFK
jgi:hypothetical protein